MAERNNPGKAGREARNGTSEKDAHYWNVVYPAQQAEARARDAAFEAYRANPAYKDRGIPTHVERAIFAAGSKAHKDQTTE
jgi:hypothetical protein